jgi:hypothetical protein
VQLKGLGQSKKSNDLIGNRTRDLPACSIVLRSRDSVLSKANGYRLDDRGGRSSSPGRFTNFLSSTLSRPALGSTKPPIQWVPVTLSPGVKQSGREGDHLPPASAEVKKMWIYICTPPYAFMV